MGVVEFGQVIDGSQSVYEIGEVHRPGIICGTIDTEINQDTAG
jgi:hypothetical protein